MNSEPIQVDGVRWGDDAANVLTTVGGSGQRRTVIKFTKIPDYEPITGKTSMPKKPLKISKQELKSSSSDFLQRSEKSSIHCQNLSRLSVMKCEKEVHTSGKFKTEEKSAITAKINYKTMFSQKNKLATEPKKLINPDIKDIAKSPKSIIRSPIRISENRNIKKTTVKETQNVSEKRTRNKQNNISEKPGVSMIASAKPNKNSRLFTNVQSRVDNNLKKSLHKPIVDNKSIIEQVKCQRGANKVISASGEVKSIHNKLVEDHITTTNRTINTSHEQIKPEMKNQTTETSPERWFVTKEQFDTREIEIQTEQVSETFTDLHMPHMNLSTEIQENKVDSDLEIDKKDLPKLKLPPFKISPRGKLKKHLDEQLSNGNMNTSIIIGKATVTYTRKKKINFQVVGASESDHSPLPSAGPLCVAPHPFTVMSVITRQLEKNERCFEKQQCDYDKAVACSWPDDLFNVKSVEDVGQHNLVKPSDLIKKMQSNNQYLEPGSLSEQFQRELNFIDSFVDSLLYLENNCVALSNPNYIKDKVNISSDTSDSQTAVNWKILSTFNNGHCNRYNHQMTANKSLCLVKLLIREERRRAKNLMFVLKMREDALKDFTKSQILYLEKKKRSEEEDVSILKKKQRGALLKLQQECGEMQRMKKALLSLSERRQNALIETKRNIELKMSTGMFDHILYSNKKSLRASPTTNNIRSVLPIKCFDLSGNSSCFDDSLNTYDSKDETNERIKLSVTPKIQEAKSEKSIQTSDSLMETGMKNEELTCPPRNAVKVDGAYLNILFHNLALPQMFSGGKEYEVNESALQNILKSADRLQEPSSFHDGNHNEKESLEKTISKSSTPSTARSLVDEFDEYFNYLGSSDMTYKRVTSTYDEPEKVHVAADENEGMRSEVSSEDNFANSDPLIVREHRATTYPSPVFPNGKESIQDMTNITVQIDTTEKPKSDISILKKELTDNNITVEESVNEKNIDCPAFSEEVVTELVATDKEIKKDPVFTIKHVSDPSVTIIACNKNEDHNTVAPKSRIKIKKCDNSIIRDIDTKLSSKTEKKQVEERPVPAVLPRKRDASVIKTIESFKSPLVRSNKQDSTCTSGLGVLDDLPMRPKSASSLSEEEELRKKQLAIELEIKALEQQIREIPDKPPPPYTPPSSETSTGTQTSAPSVVDFVTTNQRVVRALDSYCDQLYPNADPLPSLQPADSLEDLILDFCVDSIKKLKMEKAVEPWHPNNMLPPKITTTKESVKKALKEEALQILGLSDQPPEPMGPPIINKRTDYIDDILFAEWRKCEVDWTALEGDEVNVQNQLFKSIYENIVEESIEEYKTVFIKKMREVPK